MVTIEQNRRLTEVEGDAPMGRLMREHHWIPCALSETLVADGPPKPVQLLGSKYVAFRATDGRIGFFDEACPHRGVSLTLARNEDCALRCIFHAWKFDVSGKAVEVPSEGARSESFAAQVKLNHYPTFEGGGLLWVFLGQGDLPPRPPLPFLDLPADQVWMTRSLTPCNWLQGVEGTIDSVHVGTLHQSWVRKQLQDQDNATISMTLATHPHYEVEDTAYGIRAAALRKVSDVTQYLRITEYVMPFSSLVPASATEMKGSVFISVPIDNVSHMLFFGLWDEEGATGFMESQKILRTEERDNNNYARIAAGADQGWGQDREAMAQGHFTGYDGCLLDEDMVVQASMGRIADRTKEQLCAGDVGVVRARRRLLQAMAAMEQGNLESWSGGTVRPLDAVENSDYVWRNRSFENA